MDCYTVSDVTAEAKAIAAELPSSAAPQPPNLFTSLPRRCPAASGLRAGMKVT